jgi:hypothetical protein
MSDLTYWTKRLQEAGGELEAATRPTDLNVAAQRLLLAKAELKRLEQRAPTSRPASGAATSAAKPGM